MKNLYLTKFKPWLLMAIALLGAQCLIAQPAGWNFSQPFDVQENSGTTLYGYQVKVTVNTQALIANNQMKNDGSDIRFGADCPGNTLLPYWIESGINTATTTIWVKVDSLVANNTTRIFMFYGNNAATAVSDINIFSLPQSGTDSVNNTNLSGSSDAQRGFRFSPTEDILLVSFGKYTPSSTTRWVTLFDFATQAKLEQIPVSGAVNEYHYNDLPNPRWLTQGTQYLLEIFQPSGDDSYYFGAAPQMGQHAIFYDMRYCNGCTQNTFPTNTLTGMHYGYVDFLYRTRQHATVEPTITPGTPFTATVTTNSPICNGETAVVTSTGATFVWSTNSTADTLFTTPTQSTTYTVTATDIYNCVAVGSATVTVNNLPQPTITPSQAICTGNSATLTAGGGVSYLWSTNQATDEITVSPTGTTAYDVTVTDANNCSATTSTTVTVNSLPTPSITGTTPICLGESATLTGNGGTSYQWSTQETTDSITVTPATGVSTYNVTATDANSCSASASIDVTVNALPVATAMATDTILCDGESTQLMATGGVSYIWSTGAVTDTVTVTPGNNTTYSVIATDNNGCSASAQVVLTVNPLPTAGITQSPTICQNDSITLQAIGGTSYLWNTQATDDSIRVSPSINTAYNVTVTDANGCSTTIATTVTVNTLPPASAGNNQTICEGSNTTLTATGGSNFTWSTLETTASIIVTPATTTTYAVTVTDGNGCSSTANVTVNVNPAPTASAGSNQTICAGDTVTFTATGGTSYAWSTGDNTATIEVAPGTNNAYVVTVTDGNTCSASASVSVVVNTSPATPVITQNGSTLTSTAATSYQWYLNDIAINGATSQTYTAITGGSYTVEVTNGNGCSRTSAALLLTGLSQLTGGNSFTIYPNPATNLVYVTITGNTNNTLRVSLTTINGQVLQTRQVTGNTSFNLSELAAGMYLVTISDNQTTAVQKLVVNK